MVVGRAGPTARSSQSASQGHRQAASLRRCGWPDSNRPEPNHSTVARPRPTCVGRELGERVILAPESFGVVEYLSEGVSPETSSRVERVAATCEMSLRRSRPVGCDEEAGVSHPDVDRHVAKLTNLFGRVIHVESLAGAAITRIRPAKRRCPRTAWRWTRVEWSCSQSSYGRGVSRYFA